MMVANDPWSGIVIGIVFLIVGFAFRFKPGWIARHSFSRHGFRILNAVVSNKRMIIILKFIGLAFLLMGFVAILISLHF